MQLLFSVTKKDLIRQTFAAGGKGGQKQNSTNSAVRFIHPPSGAAGEARDSRHQYQNERQAFLRMAESPEFKRWHKIECARRIGGAETPEQTMARVDRMIEDGLKSGDILIEES